jgi:hypothetical protein
MRLLQWGTTKAHGKYNAIVNPSDIARPVSITFVDVSIFLRVNTTIYEIVGQWYNTTLQDGTFVNGTV